MVRLRVPIACLACQLLLTMCTPYSSPTDPLPEDPTCRTRPGGCQDRVRDSVHRQSPF
jgi:hypothetical protein